MSSTRDLERFGRRDHLIVSWASERRSKPIARGAAHKTRQVIQTEESGSHPVLPRHRRTRGPPKRGFRGRGRTAEGASFVGEFRRLRSDRLRVTVNVRNSQVVEGVPRDVVDSSRAAGGAVTARSRRVLGASRDWCMTPNSTTVSTLASGCFDLAGVAAAQLHPGRPVQSPAVACRSSPSRGRTRATCSASSRSSSTSGRRARRSRPQVRVAGETAAGEVAEPVASRWCWWAARSGLFIRHAFTVWLASLIPWPWCSWLAIARPGGRSWRAGGPWYDREPARDTTATGDQR